jgi:hypothetical protein
MQDAEKQFINSNLALLAQHYNIDIAKAQLDSGQGVVQSICTR